MSITLDTLRTLPLDDIMNRLKELKVKNIKTLTLDEIVEKMNYIPDSDDDKKSTKSGDDNKKPRVRRAPKKRAKDHQDEEMIGEDGNMYKSGEDKNGIWRWKRVENSDDDNKQEDKDVPVLLVSEKTEKKIPKKRGAPEEKAKEFPDEIKEGQDGRNYISYADKNGVYKWKLSK
jgi:hypothetical protein